MVKLRENIVITLNTDLAGGDVFLHYDRYFAFLNSSFCIKALHSGTYTMTHSIAFYRGLYPSAHSYAFISIYGECVLL